MSQGAEKIITKEDIGQPTNFIHVYHVGPDDPINVEEDNPFQVVVTSAVKKNTEEDEEEDDEEEDEFEDEDSSDEENEKKITKSDIGYPTDFRHSVHVGFSESGSFNIETEDEKLSEFLRKSGVSETHLQDDDAAEFVLEFIEKQLEREEIKGNPKYEFLKNFRTYLLENRAAKQEPTASSKEVPTTSSVQEPTPSSLQEPTTSSAQEPTTSPVQEPTTSSDQEQVAQDEDQSKKLITKEDIGHPTDFQHVTHISCNENDGFIIETNDETLSEFFKKAGVTDTDLQDRNTLEFILDYIEKHLQKEKEEVSNKEFLKNLKEYLLHFKAKYPTLTRRHKKKKKDQGHKSDEDVSKAPTHKEQEQEHESNAELMRDSILRNEEIHANEDRGG